MKWVEARLCKGAKPRELYDWLAEAPASAHHFWDEPWWEGAYVVRVAEPAVDLSECPAVDHVEPWDSSPDEEQYGEYWGHAARFFENGSVLSLDEDRRVKLVHCFLNAHGMSAREEGLFALGFAWNRATIGIRWRLYLRRRWERQQGDAT